MAQELYFSFTNSKTKMAHTPTVTGNWAACASCNAPPRGMAKERTNIAAAVSIPRISLVFGVMVVSASSFGFAPVQVATIRSGRLPTFYAGMQRTQLGFGGIKMLRRKSEFPLNNGGRGMTS